MKTTDVVVIGSGLFGSMIYRHLMDNGIRTLVVDSAHPMAASKCSFGVWKEGWVNPTIKEYVSQGYDLLEKHADGIKEIEFYNVGKQRIDSFLQVNCGNILLDEEEKIDGRVVEIDGNIVRFVRNSGDVQEIKAKKKIIVAAGAWTPDILKLAGSKDLPGVDRVWGATLEVKLNLQENRINEWAPYRQCVLVRKNGVFSFGDGATVKNPKDGMDPRVEKASNRLLEHLNDTVGTNVDHSRIEAIHEGYRPYLKKGTTSFVNKHGDWILSATGGAKNSTILCGHVAKKVLELI